MRASFASLAIVLLLAGACNSPPPPSDDAEAVQRRAATEQAARSRTGAEIQERALTRTLRTVYLCDNSLRLTVDFDNARQMATVRQSDGMAFDLFQQRTPQGIWYRAGNVDLRGAGRVARWSENTKPPTKCRAID